MKIAQSQPWLIQRAFLVKRIVPMVSSPAIEIVIVHQLLIRLKMNVREWNAVQCYFLCHLLLNFPAFKEKYDCCPSTVSCTMYVRTVNLLHTADQPDFSLALKLGTRKSTSITPINGQTSLGNWGYNLYKWKLWALTYSWYLGPLCKHQCQLRTPSCWWPFMARRPYYIREY